MISLATHPEVTRNAPTQCSAHWERFTCLVFGLHWLVNVATGPIGHPAAVLIRGLEGTTGPGRLTNELGITGALNEKAADEQTGMWFSAGQKAGRFRIIRTPRIGVEYAGPIWSVKKYRFVIQGARSGLVSPTS